MTAVRAGRPPQIKLVVLPDAPLPVQVVVTSGHVVSQHGVPGLTIAQSGRNRDDVPLVVHRATVQELDLEMCGAVRILRVQPIDHRDEVLLVGRIPPEVHVRIHLLDRHAGITEPAQLELVITPSAS